MKKRLVSIIIVFVMLFVAVMGNVGCATDGANGVDGVGIANVEINSDGELVVTLSNGDVKNLGVVKGQDGQDGIDGKDGKDGANGLNGKDGIDGLSAYEIYKKYYSYEGTEEEWLNDLIHGNLYQDDFEPVLRFAVASDIHLMYEDKALQDMAYVRTSELFNTAYDYASTDKKHNTLDAMYIVGDYTNKGTAVQANAFFDIVKGELKSETLFRAVTGNHENYSSEGLPALKKNMAYFNDGVEAQDFHDVIGGYHFIALSTPAKEASGGTAYTAAQINWLKEELKTASESDPSGTKPIFVFQHRPMANTVVTGDTYNALSSVLSQYSQVVDFSGHTHVPASNVKSIWQDGYTAINTGALRYYSDRIIGDVSTDDTSAHVENYTGAYNKLGDPVNEHDEINGREYRMIEVDSNNRVRVRTYNTELGFVGQTYILSDLDNPDKFEYTTAKKFAKAVAPEFGAEAKAQVTSLGAVGASETSKTSATIMFPQAVATDGNGVQNYKIELYKGQSLVQYKYRLALQYMYPVVNVLSVTFDGLDKGTEYSAKIYPINMYRLVGQPISTSFTTRTSNTDLGITTPDIFSISFNQDGTATNAVNGSPLRSWGTLATQPNAKTGACEGVFENKNTYQFTGINELFTSYNQAFTMEVYFKLTAFPTSTSGSFVMGCHEVARGFGFRINNSKTLSFLTYVQGTSTMQFLTSPSALSLNTYYHVVVTYDGANITMYMNGKQVVTKAMSGIIANMTDAKDNQPARVRFAYVCVGGDATDFSSSDDYKCYKGEFYMNGNVAIANIYSYVLGTNDISAKYNAVK